MKKTSLLLKSAFVLSASLLLISCVSETESPIIQEDAKLIEALATPASGEENLRKTPERSYFERFDNSLSMRPGEGFAGGPDNAYYPGTGSGTSTHMGKAVTFLNQFAQWGATGLETIGAPVTMIFEEELADLGLTGIPDEVSSITTDGKGNSVWFKNISNQVTFNSTGTRADFNAVVEIIGGTGKFVDATGDGQVTGFFNPENFQGSSSIKGKIVY